MYTFPPPAPALALASPAEEHGADGRRGSGKADRQLLGGHGIAMCPSCPHQARVRRRPNACTWPQLRLHR